MCMGNLVPKREPRIGQKQCWPGVTSVTVIHQNLPDLTLPHTKVQWVPKVAILVG